MNCIDLSRVIENGTPVFPGDPEVDLTQIYSFDSDGFSDHLLSMGMHGATHIDGPMHMTACEVKISDIPLERLAGRGGILDVRGLDVIDWDEKYRRVVESAEILLLYTGNGARWGTPAYFEQFPLISDAFAAHVASASIKMLCLDAPSPDRAPFTVHKLLLSHNVLIAENLASFEELLQVEHFSVAAFPLKIAADSSPARIVAFVGEC